MYGFLEPLQRLPGLGGEPQVAARGHLDCLKEKGKFVPRRHPEKADSVVPISFAQYRDGRDFVDPVFICHGLGAQKVVDSHLDPVEELGGLLGQAPRLGAVVALELPG